LSFAPENDDSKQCEILGDTGDSAIRSSSGKLARPERLAVICVQKPKLSRVRAINRRARGGPDSQSARALFHISND
jgi:hypothetical protein